MSRLHWFQPLRAIYEHDLQRELSAQRTHDAGERAAVDVLPTPVRDFVLASDFDASARANYARVVWRDMELRSQPSSAWMRVDCEQVNFFRRPARLALMRARLAGVLPFSGYDRYCDEHARFFINLCGRLPLRRASGCELDDSALVTYLSEAMMFPALLADPRLQWQSANATSARASIRVGKSCVSGTFTFDPEHAAARFETDDRWRDGATLTRPRWSAEIRAFRWHEGVRVPGEASACWHLEDGPFVYMRGKIDAIQYDVTDAQARTAAPQPGLAQGLLSRRVGARGAGRHA